MLNTFFGGPCAAASWVVGKDGEPRDFPDPPGADYEPAWNINTPRHDDVEGLLDWLDKVAPGWDEKLQSTYP